MSNDRETLREEYSADLMRSGVRGKFAEQFRKGTNVALIEPDLHEHFPDSAAVNKALRELLSHKNTAT